MEHLSFDDRLCHNHPTTGHPHANTVSMPKPWTPDPKSGKISTLNVPKRKIVQPMFRRTTSSDCHSIHTTVNVFLGVVDGEDLEDRQMADEGKVCHLADSIPLNPKMLQ